MRRAWGLIEYTISFGGSAGERRERTQPFVVGLVNMLVHERGMKTTVNPVDQIIREEEISRSNPSVQPNSV